MCQSASASIGLNILIPPPHPAACMLGGLGGCPMPGSVASAPLSLPLLDSRKPLGDDAHSVERPFPSLCYWSGTRHRGSSPSPAVCPWPRQPLSSTHTFHEGQWGELSEPPHGVSAPSRSQLPLSSQGSCWVCGLCRASAILRTLSCQVCFTRCPPRPTSHQPCQRKALQEPSTFSPSRARVGITSYGTMTRSGTATSS